MRPDTLNLVKKYCGTCHLTPDPAFLDRNTWNHVVLKNMGCRLGIQTTGYDPFAGMDMLNQTMLMNANIYPGEPLIEEQDWNKIITYFTAHAPDSLRVVRDSSILLTQFKTHSKGDLIEGPRVTMLYFDTLSYDMQVGIESGKMYTISRPWKVTREMNIGSTPIQYIHDNNQDLLLSVGILYPSEQKTGSLLQKVDSQWVKLLTDLHRPVWMTLADINSDGNNDFIISEFGYETGRLGWFVAGDTQYPTYSNLHPGPGSIKSITVDINKDGISDVLALIAQGNEQVTAYLGKASGGFEEKRLLSFPAIYGVCDMDILDYNKDGLMDIIISNGDNADYTKVNKPFHGIHVYLSKGQDKYEESLFLPYPGVLHSEISDFDRDGDLDIAAISFFPGDQRNPFPAFKYFEQTTADRFISRTFKTANRGKWMNMIKGDFDQDGDDDLLLGSFILNMNRVEGTREELKSNALIHLENRLFH